MHEKQKFISHPSGNDSAADKPNFGASPSLTLFWDPKAILHRGCLSSHFVTGQSFGKLLENIFV